MADDYRSNEEWDKRVVGLADPEGGYRHYDQDVSRMPAKDPNAPSVAYKGGNGQSGENSEAMRRKAIAVLGGGKKKEQQKSLEEMAQLLQSSINKEWAARNAQGPAVRNVDSEARYAKHANEVVRDRDEEMQAAIQRRNEELSKHVVRSLPEEQAAAMGPGWQAKDLPDNSHYFERAMGPFGDDPQEAGPAGPMAQGASGPAHMQYNSYFPPGTPSYIMHRDYDEPSQSAGPPIDFGQERREYDAPSEYAQPGGMYGTGRRGSPSGY